MVCHCEQLVCCFVLVISTSCEMSCYHEQMWCFVSGNCLMRCVKRAYVLGNWLCHVMFLEANVI